MTNFFPTPYEDELLYSILARYHFYSGNDDIYETIKELYNKRKVTAISDLPCNLADLISNMPSNCDYTVEELINKYTLYPFYKPFWGNIRSDKIFELMKRNPNQRVHIIAGINSSKIQQWKHLRFCPKCAHLDFEQYGELYWHRIHQAPGVIVCPIHKVIIQDSIIRTYELNSQYYYIATRENCNINSCISNYDKPIFNKLSFLAEEINWIINNNFTSIKPDDLRNRYISILQEQGMVSWKGRVNQNRVVEKFIEYYGEKFLCALSLMPDIDNVHNWVSLMLRKYDQDPHPLKHILMMNFLKGSVQAFFNTNFEKKTFGEGPYPCLNAAAHHYLQPVIKELIIEHSRNNNIFGTFYCSCGFIYSRMGPDKKEGDRYRYSTIKDYGEVWKNKLCELVEGKGLHLREVAKELKVDLQTVRKYVAKYNLNSSWMSDEAKRKIVIRTTCEILSKDDDAFLREKYRSKWVGLIESNPLVAKSKLRDFDKQTYNWLNYHDKIWFVHNTPVIKNNNKSHCKVDWNKRDIEIKNRIKDLAKQLQAAEGKPKRISKDKVGKSLGMLYLLRNSLDKLPLTKQYLNDVCESKEDFLIRRIKWAVSELIALGEEPKTWKIKQLAGAWSTQAKYINDAILNELKKI